MLDGKTIAITRSKDDATEFIALAEQNNATPVSLPTIELVSKGEHITKQKPFIVAIDDPLQEEGERTFQATLKLKNRAMATSGNYRKFRVDSTSGERFVHTINPLNGKPERSNLLSASVLAESCMLADGYATAFMALGLEKAKKLSLELEDVDVYFIYADNDSIKVYASAGFQESLLTD